MRSGMFSWGMIEGPLAGQAITLRAWQVRLAEHVMWLKRQYAIESTVREGILIASLEKILAAMEAAAAAADTGDASYPRRLAALREIMSDAGLL